MRTSITITTTGNASKTLKELAGRLGKNAEAAIKGVVEMIYVSSQVLVPKVTRTLMHSGEREATPAGLNTKGHVGYGLDPSFFETHGGKNLYPYVYAVRVHELMTPGPESQKKNDYLQNAVEARFQEAANFVLETMKR